MHKFLFYNKFILCLYMLRAGTAVAQWLWCCATNRKVAGSIPASVSGFFIDIKILPIALWPWVPGVFLGGKGGRCVRLTTYHHPVPLLRNLGALTTWNPLGLPRPVKRLFYLFTYFEHYVLIIRRSKLYYTASGIITPVGGRPVHNYYYTIWPPDDEHIVLETCRGI